MQASATLLPFELGLTSAEVVGRDLLASPV